MYEPRVGGRHDPLASEVAAQPRHLRCREVRVDDETGALSDDVMLLGEFVAHGLRAAVLPHERRGQRRTSLRVPGEDGLTLVGKGDRLDAMMPERAYELLAIRREAIIEKGGPAAKKATATKKAAAKRAAPVKKAPAKKAPAKKAAAKSASGAVKRSRASAPDWNTPRHSALGTSAAP